MAAIAVKNGANTSCEKPGRRVLYSLTTKTDNSTTMAIRTMFSKGKNQVQAAKMTMPITPEVIIKPTRTHLKTVVEEGISMVLMRKEAVKTAANGNTTKV